MRPLQDRLNQATWDTIKFSDFPATFLPSECLPDIQEVGTWQTGGSRCISIAMY